MTDLKPCPFCGGDAVGITTLMISTLHVRCIDCGAMGPGERLMTNAELAWNKRHARPARDVAQALGAAEQHAEIEIVTGKRFDSE